MKRFINIVLQILLYFWQLPQNIFGQIFLVFIKGEKKHQIGNIKFYYAKNFKGGISLGDYIIIGYIHEKSVKHEYGHCIQSKILGWLYLIIIGLPSLIHAGLCKCKKHSYYDFFTEKWANKLVGIKF